MKKLIYFISIITTVAIVAVGCGGDSYQKRLDKEKKAISKALENIEILYTYPSDHKFDKDQYYLEGSTGVYLQVVDPGNLNEVPKEIGEKQRVFLRFDSIHWMVQDSWNVGNTGQSATPIEFEYLNTATYSDDSYMSPACVLPLEKGLGNGAIVNLIVPFVNGSNYQVNYYEPFHFIGMKYTFRRESTNTGEGETPNNN